MALMQNTSPSTWFWPLTLFSFSWSFSRLITGGISLRHRKQVVVVSTKNSFRFVGCGDDDESGSIVTEFTRIVKLGKFIIYDS